VYHIKLTDAHGRTHGDTYWGPGVRHEARPGPIQLCTDTAIHFYSGDTAQEALALAVHMNPAQGALPRPRAWVFEPEGEVVTDHVKCGCKAGTTVEEVYLPDVTLEQRVEVAVRCALKVYFDARWVEWAEKWLSGEDRSEATAAAAWDTARTAWDAAVIEETLTVAWAAEAAARTAWAASEDATGAAKAAEAAAACKAGVDVAKIASAVYYGQEEVECTTSS
jgi:hypothetical protein